MKQLIIIILLSVGVSNAYAQFPPPAGQPGSTAIFKDSSIITGWATGCIVERGYQDISDLSLGLATIGDSTMALGEAGSNGVVSLGDGGSATLTFDEPISNGPGWDFAVFENSFSDDFLELAFVEVSSDGINFFRFPATSLTQDTLQIGGFGSVDATKIDNLAGKYRAQYGTPFDLEELADQNGLDIDAITHIKVIDAIGSILDEFATFDQFGNKVNDPWPTPFESSGFDLDAVAVIVQPLVNIEEERFAQQVQLFPNPARSIVNITHPSQESIRNITLTNTIGQVFPVPVQNGSNGSITLEVSQIPNGLFFLRLNTTKGTITKRLMIQHD